MNQNGFICYCGHCGNTGIMQFIAQINSFKELPLSDEVVNPLCRIISNTETTSWFLYQCLICGKPTLISTTIINGVTNIIEEPKYQFPISNIDYTGVPEIIKTAFESAIKTKGINRAICILSLRRTLEMICKDKGAEGKDLDSKIKDLINKKILPEMMDDACWIVRQSGNDAAHADNVEFTEQEVQAVIHYVSVVIEYLYSMPVRVAELKSKIMERKNKKA